MTPLPRITLLVALMALGACRSDPIQFHTLTRPQTRSSSKVSAYRRRLTGPNWSSVKATAAWPSWKPNGGAPPWWMSCAAPWSTS
jgi:hypothetical protein